MTSESTTLTRDKDPSQTATAGAPAGALDDYRELKRRIAAAGLLARRPSSQLLHAVWIGVALIGVVTVMARVDGVLWQALAGLALAFVTTHIGFLMHDAGHQQLFASPRWNRWVGLLTGNLLTGLSYGWWVDKHNRHHSHPNQIDHDPDIDFPVVAFSEEQALSKPAPYRWIVRHQAFWFIPLLLLEAFSLRAGAFAFVLGQGARHRTRELLLLGAHYAIYLGLIVAFLEPGPALAFVACHQAAIGLYTGAVFAPNHKGMPVYDRDEEPGFVERQVVTSRNVRAGVVTDFLYGGLNHQIEHHLFPTLPRPQLGRARRLVREFCKERDIPYTETGVVQSFREILRHLHRVSAPLRTAGRSGPHPQTDQEASHDRSGDDRA